MAFKKIVGFGQNTPLLIVATASRVAEKNSAPQLAAARVKSTVNERRYIQLNICENQIPNGI